MDTSYSWAYLATHFKKMVDLLLLSQHKLQKNLKILFDVLDKGSLISKGNWFLVIKNLILHFWPELSILECFILEIWILAHFLKMKKCAKIQILKINHSRIENSGQKWRMRFFMAKTQLLFEIKLPLTEMELMFLKTTQNYWF